MKKLITLKFLLPLWLAAPWLLGQEPDAGQPPQLAAEEKVLLYTQEWEGERDQYGRPLVPDHILERMAHVGVEEAWSALRSAGYHHQMETGWEMLDHTHVMVGRALTTAFLPRRSELDDRLIATGRARGLSGGGTNQWPIDLLEEGDVIVADNYGKPTEAAFFGDNLAQAIHARSGTGAIVFGQARDLAGVRDIEGFKAWVKYWHPSASPGVKQRMLVSINDIIRIGEAVVLPGDVVLATEAGVIFIPPHLAEKVIVGSEVIRLVDGFRIEAMGEGKYTSQQVYVPEWEPAVEEQFFKWLETDKERIHEQYRSSMDVIDRLIESHDRSWEQWFDGNKMIPLEK